MPQSDPFPSSAGAGYRSLCELARLSTPRPGNGVRIGTWIGRGGRRERSPRVCIGELPGRCAGVFVRVAVARGVRELAGVAVAGGLPGVAVQVTTEVGGGVGVPVGVLVEVPGRGVEVFVGVRVDVPGGRVEVAVRVGVGVDVRVGVAVGVRVGVAVGVVAGPVIVIMAPEPEPGIVTGPCEGDPG